MPRPRTPLVLGLLVGLTTAVLSTSLAATAATGSVPAASASGFSDPVYYPVRDPVLVGCVTTNCPHADHKGFAINVDARDKQLGADAVYAMGAGIAHVGAPVGVDNCGTSAKPTLGNWVWVDHGGGVVSEYLHLNSVTSGLNGAYVTPRTQIGTMGDTGDNKCGTPYLDFFVRNGGIHGATVAITTLTACQASQPVTYPSAFTDASTWAAVRYKTPADSTLDNNCLATSFASPLTPTGVKAAALHGEAKVRWTAPAATEHVNGVRLEMELYHPSTGSYNYPTYRTLAGNATASTVTSLQPKRSYRFLVSFHNATGWSHSSRWVKTTIR